MSSRGLITDAINAIQIAGMVSSNSSCFKLHEEEEVKEINMLIITTGQT